MHSEVREALILSLGTQVELIAAQMSRRIPTAINSDLVSEGWLGAIKAVDAFDESKDVKLRTFAECKIRGAMLDYLRRLDFMSRSDRRKAREGEASMLPRAPLSLEQMNERGEVNCQAKADADPAIGHDLTRIIARARLTRQEFRFVACHLREEMMIDAARELGVHPSRVSQLKASSMLKMRAAK